MPTLSARSEAFLSPCERRLDAKPHSCDLQAQEEGHRRDTGRPPDPPQPGINESPKAGNPDRDGQNDLRWREVPAGDSGNSQQKQPDQNHNEQPESKDGECRTDTPLTATQKGGREW